MKNRAEINAVAVVIGCITGILFCTPLTALDRDSKPQNYDEIKALLDSHANAIDSYGDIPDSGRKKLLAGGDEEVPALIALLKAEDPFGQYKSAIVTVLAYNKAINKKRSAALLAEQLPDNAETWNRWWIVQVIQFLTRADADLARATAKRGLQAKMPEIKYAAVESLGKVGVATDIDQLSMFLSQWQASYAATGVKYSASEDEMGKAVIAAEELILMRTRPIDLATYLTFYNKLHKIYP